MAISIWSVSITHVPIELASQKHDSAAGAVVDFFGIVRALEGDRVITGIEYEANMAMAEYQLNAIAEKAATDFALLRIIITHRIGFVKVAEPSLFLRVESAHRSAALSASAWMIDELKQKVPIWKRPVFAAGREYERESKKDNAPPAESSLRA
jgi:molybdopterin synthase catalytic subunit